MRTLTLPLSPDLERHLLDRAQRHGLSLEEMAALSVRRGLDLSPPPILELAGPLPTSAVLLDPNA